MTYQLYLVKKNKDKLNDSNKAQAKQILDNKNLQKNDGDLSSYQVYPEIEQRIINGNPINPNEIDKSFPFGVPEFEKLDILNKNKDGKIFKQLIQRHPEVLYHFQLPDSNWETSKFPDFEKPIIVVFQKACKILLKNIPRYNDSIEEKMIKLFELQNSVGELVRKAKDQSVPGEEGKEYRDYLDFLENSFYEDLHKTYPLRN